MRKKILCLALWVSALQLSHAQTFDQLKAAHDQKDYVTAFEGFTKLAKAGDSRAQVTLGGMYELGQGVPKNWSVNIKEAEFWYLLAAAKGNAQAQHNLGFLYSRGYIPGKSTPEAIEYFQKAAEQGDIKSMQELGRSYTMNRDGQVCDIKLAEKWFLKAAELSDLIRAGKRTGFKHFSERTAIGDMYFSGTCGTRDEQLALKWYKLAASKGERLGQFKLGLGYLDGLYDLKKDAKEAAKWVQKSAAHDYVPALDLMGVMYAQGNGVEQNDQKAVALFSRAAEEGWGESQFNLGWLYSVGRGVPKDLEMAYYWITISKRQVEELADRELTRIRPNLTETQLIAAENKAKQFKSRFDW